MRKEEGRRKKDIMRKENINIRQHEKEELEEKTE